MKVWEVMKFLEEVVGSLEEISSSQELGRLLLERMRFAFMEEGELHLPPQDEAEKK